MNKENCALKLFDEIILYYDARSKKTSKEIFMLLNEIHNSMKSNCDTLINVTDCTL